MPGDNGTLAPNPDQRDADQDGFGKVCDAGLDNDGIETLPEYNLFVSVFFAAAPGVEPFVLADHADFDNTNSVARCDYSLPRRSFGEGPGLSCCGGCSAAMDESVSPGVSGQVSNSRF